jgi:fatty acid desaturase
LAATLTKDELRDLKAISEPSDRKGLLHLTGHLTTIGCTTALIWLLRDSGWWVIPAMLLQGVALIFLFAPEHECIHATAFRSRRLNASVAWFSGLVLALPPAYFRAFHLAHHRYTQDPQADPELATPKPETIGEYLLHVSGWPYWRDAVSGLVRHAIGRVAENFIAPRERPAVIREARVFLGIYAAVAALSLAFSNWAAVVYWIGPVLLGQPFLRLYLLAEHTGCPETPDMLRNTRTTLTNPAIRALAWNMPYHTEHHVYPAVPFHALPAAHQLIRHRLSVVDNGYVAVTCQILGSLRLARPPLRD